MYLYKFGIFSSAKIFLFPVTKTANIYTLSQYADTLNPTYRDSASNLF